MGFSIPPFPVSALPENLASFVRNTAQSMWCPEDFIGVFSLTVLSAAIGTARSIRVKDRWTEPAVLYTAIVASPGSKKSPALKAVLEPVYELQAEQQHVYKQHKAQYDIELENWQKNKKKSTKPDKPRFVRNHVNDFTFEALAKILSFNRKGVLLTLDELAGWVKSMNQYRKGQGADLEKWLSLWSCTDLTIDRVSLDEAIFIAKPFVSVTGGIQPDRLKLFHSKDNDGFLDRILFSFPEPMPDKWIEDEVPASDLAAYKEVYYQLYELSPTDEEALRPKPIMLDFDAEAKKAFIHFFNKNNAECDQTPSSNLAASYRKMNAYAARLALILQLIENPDSQLVALNAVKGAATLIEYFKAHTRKVYAQLGKEKITNQVLRAVETIKSYGREMTLREFYTKSVAGCKDADSARRLFKELEKQGYGVVLEKKNSTGGRSTMCFRLNAA